MATTLVGRRVRLSMDHLLQTVTFTAVVIKESDAEVSVRIPARIRRLQWTAYPEAAYRFPRAVAERALVDCA